MVTALKFVHILLAIVAVGFNASYGAWLARAKKQPEHLDFALRGVKFLDDYVANPCYVLLLASGLLLMWKSGYTFSDAHWLGVGLILWVLLAVTAIGIYTPTLRGQIHALQAEGAGGATFKRLELRAQIVGPLLGVIVLAIVFLMVVKPTL